MIEIPRSSAAKMRKQVKLIDDCIRGDIRLSDALRHVGWTYEDLRYENDRRPVIVHATHATLGDFTRAQLDIPIVSFFSGAGGLDLGFEAAGFSHCALIERNELFCKTLRINRRLWNVLGPPSHAGDVSDFEGLVAQLEARIGLRPFEGVFVGGPPCQPFSIAANQRFSKSGKDFKRVGFAHKTNGNLLFDFIGLIKRFQPAAFLIENVPGLLDVDGGEQLENAYRTLRSVGYTVEEPIVLLAAEYGVPQNRNRLFILGNRGGKPFIPPRRHGHQVCCDPIFRLSLDGVENHTTREHSAESVRRYMALDYGDRDQLGRVDRLDPALPSKTVIAGGTSGGGRSHLHPYVPRTLSVRECARLQTFPDTYIFEGPSARQFTQVGNAVPPVLAAQLGNAVAESYFL